MGGISAAPISTIPLLKDLQEIDGNGSARSCGTIHSTKMKPYVKRVQYHIEPWVPTHDQFYRSPELAFDPGDLVRYPSKVVACVLDQEIEGSMDDRRAGEVESDGRQVRGGGGSEC